MLALTPEAIPGVFDFVGARDAAAGAGLRISAGPPSAAEPTWNYAVVPEPSDGDLVIEDGPARVFVDPDVAEDLDHAVLDARVDEQTLETRFSIRTQPG
jgi:iron-sulfur cluster assembly protein